MAVGAKRWPPVWLQRHTRAVGPAGRQLDVQQGAPAPAARVAPAVAAHEHLGRRVADRRSASRAGRGRARRAARRAARARSAIGTRWSTPTRRCVPARRWWTTRTSPSAPTSSARGTTVISRAPGSAAASASAGISLTSDGHGSGHSTRSSWSKAPAEPIGSTPWACVHGEQRKSGSRRWASGRRHRRRSSPARVRVDGAVAADPG